ncbi:hypothetical protein AMTRI_Chr03g145670 [Amborella trichopoda]
MASFICGSVSLPLCSFSLETDHPSSVSSRLPNRLQSLRINAAVAKWEPSKKSAGGVLLPKSAVKLERYLMGEVLSVGKEVGSVEAGKKVLFSDLSAYEVDLGTDGKHCFCRESDLLALVE